MFSVPTPGKIIPTTVEPNTTRIEHNIAAAVRQKAGLDFDPVGDEGPRSYKDFVDKYYDPKTKQWSREIYTDPNLKWRMGEAARNDAEKKRAEDQRAKNAEKYEEELDKRKKAMEKQARQIFQNLYKAKTVEEQTAAQNAYAKAMADYDEIKGMSSEEWAKHVAEQKEQEQQPEEEGEPSKWKQVGDNVKQGLVDEIRNMLSNPPTESPEQNAHRETIVNNTNRAAEIEAAKKVAQGEANRNVEEIAGKWTETSANNAANVAAQAAGGDTGAGSAIARMAAAQGARDKEGAQNLQNAQARKDKYEDVALQRGGQQTTALNAVAGTKLQAAADTQQWKNNQDWNKRVNLLFDEQLKHLGAGSTTKGLNSEVANDNSDVVDKTSPAVTNPATEAAQAVEDAKNTKSKGAGQTDMHGAEASAGNASVDDTQKLAEAFSQKTYGKSYDQLTPEQKAEADASVTGGTVQKPQGVAVAERSLAGWLPRVGMDPAFIPTYKEDVQTLGQLYDQQKVDLNDPSLSNHFLQIQRRKDPQQKLDEWNAFMADVKRRIQTGQGA